MSLARSLVDHFRHAWLLASLVLVVLIAPFLPALRLLGVGLLDAFLILTILVARLVALQISQGGAPAAGAGTP